MPCFRKLIYIKYLLTILLLLFIVNYKKSDCFSFLQVENYTYTKTENLLNVVRNFSNFKQNRIV